MSGFNLLSVAASLLPLLGASGADREKGQDVTQVVQQRIDPSARMLNIALATVICGGKNQVCGSPSKLGPANNETMWVIKHYTYPNGSCERYQGSEVDVNTWKNQNCMSVGFGFFDWFGCLLA